MYKPNFKYWCLPKCYLQTSLQKFADCCLGGRIRRVECYLSEFRCCYMGVEASWNVMAHAQIPDFVFWRNGRVHLNRRERQFSRLLAAEVCASVVVMLDTSCSEVVWRVLPTHSIRQFPLHFPSRVPSHFNWSPQDCSTCTATHIHSWKFWKWLIQTAWEQNDDAASTCELVRPSASWSSFSEVK